MRSYTFKVVVEPDDDRWHAYCPALKEQGAATWGTTEAEALRNLREVVEMVVESMLAHHDPLPSESSALVTVRDEPVVAVTV